MIPRSVIQSWAVTKPWPTLHAVEQDLVLARLIVEIAEHPQHVASAGRAQQPRNPRQWTPRASVGRSTTLEDMTPDTATLIRDGLALDADQRAVVANALLESLHDAGDTGEIDAAWRAEATRRLTEVRAGAVELVDADEHYERLRASLTA